MGSKLHLQLPFKDEKIWEPVGQTPPTPEEMPKLEWSQLYPLGQGICSSGPALPIPPFTSRTYWPLERISIHEPGKQAFR